MLVRYKTLLKQNLQVLQPLLSFAMNHLIHMSPYLVNRDVFNAKKLFIKPCAIYQTLINT